MACLDTTIFIDLRRRSQHDLRKRAEQVMAKLLRDGEPLATTMFNVAELYVGVELSRHPARELQEVAALVRDLDLLVFGPRAVPHFGALKARARSSGQPVGDMDVLIAATCIAEGHDLVTRNPRHFAGMAGLTVIDYCRATTARWAGGITKRSRAFDRLHAGVTV